MWLGIMKRTCLGLMALGLAVAFPAALVAEEVAVVNVQFGKDKKGRKEFTIGFFEQEAPKTVENFKRLAKKRFYNGMRFHRVFPGVMVQTGDPLSKRKHNDYRLGTGGPGYTLAPEIRHKHEAGAVAMGRLPDPVNPTRASNGSQFYIAVAPNPELDQGYTVFGKVIEGLDVVDTISRAGRDTNDVPSERIVIRSIKLVNRAPAS
jgi:peptidyl-prolyl cis-trans isomerase B (cyclophilin B)